MVCFERKKSRIFRSHFENYARASTIRGQPSSPFSRVNPYDNTHPSLLHEEGHEVHVPVVRRVEDDAVLVGGAEVDAELGPLLHLGAALELQVGVGLGAY